MQLIFTEMKGLSVDVPDIHPKPTQIQSMLRPSGQRWLGRVLHRVAGWFVLWTLVGVFFATQMIASSQFFRGETVTWSEVVVPAFFLAWFCGLYSHLIKAIVRRFPLYRYSWGKALLLHLLAAIMFAVSYVALANSLFQEGHASLNWTERFWLLLKSFFHMQLMIYVAIAAVCQIIEFQKWVRARERQSAELRVQLANAQLNQLKSQLHPHFLFNTLNAITAFIHDDPDTAMKITSRLGDLLRTVLENQETQMGSVEQELAFIRKYMDIQQIRFGERLTYLEEVPKHLTALQIPVLILQPLVENAVQHGVAASTNPCQIQIRASEDSHSLRIEIIDDGPGCDWDQNPSLGVGIQNTRDRLEQLYGGAGKLELMKNENTGTIARLQIPLVDNDSAVGK